MWESFTCFCRQSDDDRPESCPFNEFQLLRGYHILTVSIRLSSPLNLPSSFRFCTRRRQSGLYHASLSAVRCKMSKVKGTEVIVVVQNVCPPLVAANCKKTSTRHVDLRSFVTPYAPQKSGTAQRFSNVLRSRFCAFDRLLSSLQQHRSRRPQRCRRLPLLSNMLGPFRICRGESEEKPLRGDIFAPSTSLTPDTCTSSPAKRKGGPKARAATKWTKKENEVPNLRESFGSDCDDSSEPERIVANETTQTELRHEKYMKSREMSPLQERVNGVTTLPAGLYCFLFLLSGSWLDMALFQHARDEMSLEDFDGDGCISISWLPNLHALPPLPVIAAALSMILHMPFSFIYHWTYAHRLSPTARLNHWSRRMDQCMLHVYSALLSYAFSGRADIFVMNTMFNIDCICRQFEKKVIPKRNKARLFLSIFAFTIPILQEGDYAYFGRLWGTMLAAFAVFASYPVGGWSHTLFHLIFLSVPPLMMTHIPGLPASQGQLNFAAKCAILAESNIRM